MLNTRLKHLREINNITQSNMATVLNIALQAYQRYEQGNRQPKLDVIIYLANYFCVSLDYLVGRSDEPEYEKYVPLAEAAFWAAAPAELAKQYQAEAQDLQLEAKPALIRKYETLLS